MKICLHFSVNRNPFSLDLSTLMWFTSFSWGARRMLIGSEEKGRSSKGSQRVKHQRVMNAAKALYQCGINHSRMLCHDPMNTTIKCCFTHYQTAHCQFINTLVYEVHDILCIEKTAVYNKWQLYHIHSMHIARTSFALLFAL